MKFRYLWNLWTKIDPLLSLGGYLWLVLSLLGIPVAVAVGYMASQLAWFWSTFSWFGVLGVSIIAWVVIGVGLNVYSHAKFYGGRTVDPLLMITIISAVAFVVALSLYAVKPRDDEHSGIASPAGLQDAWITAPFIEWDGGANIVFRGTFLRPGEKLLVYVDYRCGGGPEDRYVIDRPINASNTRVKVGETEGRFVSGESLSVLIGLISDMEGNQKVLQWGDKKYGNQTVGISYSDCTAKIVLVGPDNREDSYPFMIISRTWNNRPIPPIIIGPGLFRSFVTGSNSKKLTLRRNREAQVENIQ